MKLHEKRVGWHAEPGSLWKLIHCASESFFNLVDVLENSLDVFSLHADGRVEDGWPLSFPDPGTMVLDACFNFGGHDGES